MPPLRRLVLAWGAAALLANAGWADAAEPALWSAHGEIIHRATNGSWVNLRVGDARGTWLYRLTRLDPHAPALPPLSAHVITVAGQAVLPTAGELTRSRLSFAGGSEEDVSLRLLDVRVRAEEPPPTFRNVPYGPGPCTLDAYLVASKRPAAVAIYIHGGAWTAGDKGELAHYLPFLRAGIAVFSINYRFCPAENPGPDTPAVAVPMGDIARAVQFIRSRSREWHLDPKRVGLWGASAGACSALWLATHADLADPDSLDPVARESTRPQCVAAILAQTSLDPVQMRAWAGPRIAYGAHAFGVSTGRTPHDFAKFVAARDRLLPWIRRYSPAALVRREGPPIFLDYLDFSLTPCEALDAYFTHSPGFGVGFAAECARLGRECHLRYEGQEDARYASWQAFLLAELGGA
jgi:acetyl esterase/lipase